MLCGLAFSLVKKLVGLQPPALLFIFCLLVFGLTMFTISSDLENQILPNPDIDMDWNIFMRRLSRLHYCVSPAQSVPLQKTTLPKNATRSPDQPKVQVVDEGNSLAALLPDLNLHLGSAVHRDDFDTLKSNVTIAVSVKGRFHRSVLTEPMSWHASASGDIVGARGMLARSSFKMVMLLWPDEEDLQSASSNDLVNTEICLIIQGPAEILPRTKPPPKCYLRAIPPKVTREVKVQRTAADMQGKQGDICTAGTWTSFAYTTDEALEVFLSKTDLLLVKERLQKCGTLLISISFLLIFGAALTLHTHSSIRRYALPHRVVQTTSESCLLKIPQVLY